MFGPFGPEHEPNWTMASLDDVQQWQMGSEKFGAVQRLRSAYHDGHLEAVQEAWMEIDPDFSMDVEIV